MNAMYLSICIKCVYVMCVYIYIESMSIHNIYKCVCIDMSTCIHIHPSIHTHTHILLPVVATTPSIYRTKKDNT